MSDVTKNLNEQKTKRLRNERLRLMREKLEQETKELETDFISELLDFLKITALLKRFSKQVFEIKKFMKRFGQLVYLSVFLLLFIITTLIIITDISQNGKKIFLDSIALRTQIDEGIENFSLNQDEPEERLDEFVKKAVEQDYQRTTKSFEEELRTSREAAQSSELLAQHPDETLIENTEDGRLPRIGDDGRLPLQVYARPYDILENRPAIGIIVSNLGLSESKTRIAISLPAFISLAYSPYTSNIKEWVTTSRSHGHEVFLNVPMEPAEYPNDDPGPLGLLLSASDEEVVLNLRKILGLTSGYIGLVPIMGEAFLQDEPATKQVLEILQLRGISFLDSRTTLSSKAPVIMESLGMEGSQVDLALTQSELNADSINQSLAQLVNVVKKNGTAILLINPHNNILSTVAGWIRTLDSQNIALLPVSAIIEKRKQ